MKLFPKVSYWSITCGPTWRKLWKESHQTLAKKTKQLLKQLKKDIQTPVSGSQNQSKKKKKTLRSPVHAFPIPGFCLLMISTSESPVSSHQYGISNQCNSRVLASESLLLISFQIVLMRTEYLGALFFFLWNVMWHTKKKKKKKKKEGGGQKKTRSINDREEESDPTLEITPLK